jgi:4,5-DOPA dioxygenase extradiol
MNNITDNVSNTALFVSHGGGPLPLLGDPGHEELVVVLKSVVTHLAKPSVIIVISAHWEAAKPTITAGKNPQLVYDYYGFPEASYNIRYPAPGEPVLARNIFNVLRENGIDSVLDEQRGFDHGLFVPLKIMYPEADIPCVQVSLMNSLRPADHIQLGNALRGLTEGNVLVLGSGFSFHNMKAFFSEATSEQRLLNKAFEDWLIETCSSDHLDEQEREQRLIHWETAPGARYCQPREEHLLPLHVCYGFAKSRARQVFTFNVMGKQASAYLW